MRPGVWKAPGEISSSLWQVILERSQNGISVNAWRRVKIQLLELYLHAIVAPGLNPRSDVGEPITKPRATQPEAKGRRACSHAAQLGEVLCRISEQAGGIAFTHPAIAANE